jgi:hypothetical protein
MVMALESFFVLPGIIATVVPLVLAVLVVMGSRWSLPVSTLFAALGLYTALLSPIAMARLTRVDDPLAMLAGIAEVAGLALATVAGVVGTYQAYAPRRGLSSKGAA